jgi:hypothetical protein
MPGLASLRGVRLKQPTIGTAMTNSMHRALIATLGAVTLMFAAGETSARSGAVQGTSVAAARAMVHPAPGRAFRHHRRSFIGPGIGGFFYGPDGVPLIDATQAPPSNDYRYTYTYDVPWDWAHRYPPNVVPSDRPYVSNCGSETVTVPGRDGTEQTVNVMRCY